MVTTPFLFANKKIKLIKSKIIVPETFIRNQTVSAAFYIPSVQVKKIIK